MDDFPQLFTLKQMLLDANATIDDLKGVMQFFFNNLGNDPEFLKAGDWTTNKDVDGMLEGLAYRLFGQNLDMEGTPVVELPRYHFIHGAFSMNGKNGTVIYFADVGKGLIALAWSANETKYTPFTVSGPFAGNAPGGHGAYRRNFNKRNKPG
jgi:hypothetical protein